MTTLAKTCVYLDECKICHCRDNLESHHIVWQKDFDNNNINKNKFHLQKNDASNLVTLCQSCHDKVDRDEIIINGWLDTSNGRQLDYVIVRGVVEKKTKYSPELVSFIVELRGSDKKMTQIKIKEKFNKKISTKSIQSIWST